MAVLHLDDVVNKKSASEVAYVFEKLLSPSGRPPVQVAFMQGAIPVQSEPLFSKLLEFLAPGFGEGTRGACGVEEESGSAARAQCDDFAAAHDAAFRTDTCEMGTGTGSPVRTCVQEESLLRAGARGAAKKTRAWRRGGHVWLGRRVALERDYGAALLWTCASEG